jgi:hypothetical protein
VDSSGKTITAFSEDELRAKLADATRRYAVEAVQLFLWMPAAPGKLTIINTTWRALVAALAARAEEMEAMR